MNIKDLKINLNIIKEGKAVIAYSPALDLSSSGKNLKEAKSRFIEVTRIFFEDLTKRGVLDEVLIELGWSKKVISKKLEWKPPRVDHRYINVSVPTTA